MISNIAMVSKCGFTSTSSNRIARRSCLHRDQTLPLPGGYGFLLPSNSSFTTLYGPGMFGFQILRPSSAAGHTSLSTGLIRYTPPKPPATIDPLSRQRNVVLQHETLAITIYGVPISGKCFKSPRFLLDTPAIAGMLPWPSDMDFKPVRLSYQYAQDIFSAFASTILGLNDFCLPSPHRLFRSLYLRGSRAPI
jgi:hypothetical protein